MITLNNFKKTWLDDRVSVFRKNNVKADPLLIEKVVHALYLLELLVEHKVEFIFKGGTSLILLLERPARFSIDIDIMMERELGDDTFMDIFLNFTCGDSPFKRVEENKRKDRGIPKKHYKFFYDSKQDLRNEQYILLDILFEENPYASLVDKPITGIMLETIEPHHTVRMPSVECILGDKLTAYAPNTTGIPYGKDKETEIIKQLFDVATLHDCIDANSIAKVKTTFDACALQNIAYRSLEKVNPKDVLTDVIETSLTILQNGKKDKVQFEELGKGIAKFKSYVFTEKYSRDRAVNSSAKAAHLALVLRDPERIKFERYTGQLPKDLEIPSEYNKALKRLLKIDEEAYYYWAKVLHSINS